MTVVADSTPLIALAALGKLALLRSLYREIAVPEAVFHEVVIEGAGRPGALEVANSLWIKVVPENAIPSSLVLPKNLGAGEAQSIRLSLSNAPSLLILDDMDARRAAAALGLAITGTVGVLQTARKEGLISGLGPELDRLRAFGFHISKILYETALKSVGESQ